MAYKVFISYSTKDLIFVERVKQLLTQPTVEVFIAEHSVLPGTPLRETIMAGIKTCDLFILLWSQNSKSSEWVAQEIGIAKSSDKLIVPILIEKDLQLPAFIDDIKFLPAYENSEKSLKWLQTNVLERAHKQKQQSEIVVLLGILSLIILLATQK